MVRVHDRDTREEFIFGTGTLTREYGGTWENLSCHHHLLCDRLPQLQLPHKQNLHRHPHRKPLVLGGVLTRLRRQLVTIQNRSSTICDIHHENPITRSANVGDLAEDVISICSPATVDRFIFSCSPESLATGAKGMLGFRKIEDLHLNRKPSTILIFPENLHFAYLHPPGSYSPAAAAASRTPYLNGRRVALHDGGAVVEVSTVVPYTTMTTPIYGIFTKAYLNAARSMNMTTVAPVAPFDVCFSSRHTTSVPEIELVLQSEMVKWRIEGSNSMVQVMIQ